jgi:hypothetical protein
MGQEDDSGRDGRSSTSFYLTGGDLGEFRPGRRKHEVLRNVQWRGHFDMATTCDGKPVVTITYELLAEPQRSDRGKVVTAIFVNDRFVKFISWLPGDMEEVDYEGTKWRRPKPNKLGDCTSLVRAMKAEPLRTKDLEKETKLIPSPPEHTDIGLTTAWLVLREAIRGASEADYKRNAALRDQFNAARLEIGMPESEVESIFKAKPLESGPISGGSYQIYGSNESFNLDTWLHFSNVLIVFRQGRADVIYGIPAGDEWRRKVGQLFPDLGLHRKP